jgi:hypothetical protein
MKKQYILGPKEVLEAMQAYIEKREGIWPPDHAAVDARVRAPDTANPETYIIVAWDAAE